MDRREDYELLPFTREPPRRALHRVTLTLCAVAAVAEPALWVAGAGGFSDSDVILLIMLTAPYLFFALYVWLQRRRTAASWVLFGSVVVVAAVGLAVAGAHAVRSLTMGVTGAAPNRGGGVAAVGCFHWLMVFVCGLLSVVVSAIASSGQDRFAPERRPRRRRTHPEDED
jgi:hypothetical protein